MSKDTKEGFKHLQRIFGENAVRDNGNGTYTLDIGTYDTNFAAPERPHPKGYVHPTKAAEENYNRRREDYENITNHNSQVAAQKLDEFIKALNADKPSGAMKYTTSDLNMNYTYGGMFNQHFTATVSAPRIEQDAVNALASIEDGKFSNIPSGHLRDAKREATANKPGLAELKRIFGDEIVKDTLDGYYIISLGGHVGKGGLDIDSLNASLGAQSRMMPFATRLYELSAPILKNGLQFEMSREEDDGVQNFIATIKQELIEDSRTVAALKTIERGEFDELVNYHLGTKEAAAAKVDAKQKELEDILIVRFNGISGETGVKWKIVDGPDGKRTLMTRQPVVEPGKFLIGLQFLFECTLTLPPAGQGNISIPVEALKGKDLEKLREPGKLRDCLQPPSRQLTPGG